MPKRLSEERISEIIEVLGGCGSCGEAAQKLGVTASTVYQWGRKYPQIRKAIPWKRKQGEPGGKPLRRHDLEPSSGGASLQTGYDGAEFALQVTFRARTIGELGRIYAAVQHALAAIDPAATEEQT